jgi:hypothetical protein
MAHFVRLGLDSTVQEIVVVENTVLLDDEGVEQESLGQQFLASLGLEGTWVQCSYNETFRGGYPGHGWTYDADLDEFVAPEVSDEVV